MILSKSEFSLNWRMFDRWCDLKPTFWRSLEGEFNSSHPRLLLLSKRFHLLTDAHLEAVRLCQNSVSTVSSLGVATAIYLGWRLLQIFCSASVLLICLMVWEFCFCCDWDAGKASLDSVYWSCEEFVEFGIARLFFLSFPDRRYSYLHFYVMTLLVFLLRSFGVWSLGFLLKVHVQNSYQTFGRLRRPFMISLFSEVFVLIIRCLFPLKIC